MKRFTLYWSSLEKYENCPRQFLWYKGWGAIDVGGGPGRGKPYPVQESKHHPVMGHVIQGVIEDMYNNELWKHPATLAATLQEKVEREFNYQLNKKRNWIDWDHPATPTRAEMLQICRDGVAGYLRTMKQHRLAGRVARAEVELFGYVDKYTPIAGRADMVIRRDNAPLQGITILDGKNSKSKGKYTDPDQLRWYALCFRLAYRKLPDRVGFVYYRYPYGTPVRDSDGQLPLDADGNPTGEVEEGIEWVDFTEDDLRGLAQRAIDVRKDMEKEKFHPTPTPKGCQWCVFQTVCDARIEQKAANRRPRKSVFEGTGIQELDLGG